MKLFGKEINDECSRCGNVLDCELFRKGHGIGGNRENVADMIKCQFEHREKSKNQCGQ
jgi:hypothetical protein